MKKNQHEWGFMGNEVGNKHTGDLIYCPLCNQWSWSDRDANTGKEILFKMSRKKYEEMIKNNEIDGV